ncbi:efflux transporter outer membrane subunit [Methylocapsa polymorpha]|uniref:Efflux transporter outer membrane subunit n=1 Tax=Methylocapsa polymorpha TaxID=3080828 RepID=A0ABZ0HQB2_9HYPH|nr:efflux transporter outer membrane subunit [Methylocapsa sp. RX1]
MGREKTCARPGQADVTGRKLQISAAAVGVPMILLSACAVGPNFEPPPAPEATGYTPEPLAPQTAASPGPEGKAQRFVQGLDIPGQWWAVFHSRPLNDLIEDALRHNPDLQAAQAALRAAHENTEAQKGLLYPQASANFNPIGGKTGEDVAPILSNNSVFYSLTIAQVSVSYAPDVFGLVRRGLESLEAQTQGELFQLEATYLTLTSNVVAAAIQEASLRAQIEATKKIVAIETDLLGLLRRQLSLGQVAGGDVALQEAALAQAEETLPPLEKQLAQQRDLLTALAGRYPSAEVAQKFTLASLRLPRDLPVSLPSQLVEHRPDVKAASANLHSASALVGVAIANRLPVISLTADLGSSPANLANLFSPPTFFYTLAGNVTQTLFDGFTLYHKQKAAEAALEQAEAQYRSTVITAFQNVADSLRALQADARALKAANAAEAAAHTSLEITRKQLLLGEVNFLALLTSEQTYLQAVLAHAQAEANRFADTAALFQALGGGWWNRNDVATTANAD